MKVAILLLALLLILPLEVAAEETAHSLGPREGTHVIQGRETETFCPATSLRRNDDGSFENAYMWSFSGVQEPDYGSWAECFNAQFVCGIQFVFTKQLEPPAFTMDVYVWESLAEGDPPPGPDPGNVICVVRDVSPWPIAEWPEFSTHDIQICCETGGEHFVGYWVNAPFDFDSWFIAADEDGTGEGCPRTKFAPGIGYPTGWAHPNLVPIFDCKGLGIREFAGQGDCQTSSVSDPDGGDPDTRKKTTWGAIKGLY